MKTLELKVKYSHEDTVYTTKQTKLEIPCYVCNEEGTISYIGKNIKCPECSGKGKFISNKKVHTVCEEPFVISRIKVSIGVNGGSNVKYKGRCGLSTLNRSEENLFSTKEKAQEKCDELNKVKMTIALSEVVIPDSFKITQPSPEKIKNKLDYFIYNNKFDKPIVINRHKVLQDGYINYLICKLLNNNTINAEIEG